MNDINKYRLLDNLFNVYLDSPFDEEDEKEYADDGIDVDEIVRENVMLFKQLKIQTKADINRIKHERVLSFLSKLREGLKANVQEYKEIADRILAKPKLAELQPLFKNYESSSNDDKKSLAFDSEMLDMLSDIEEEYNRDVKHED